MFVVSKSEAGQKKPAAAFLLSEQQADLNREAYCSFSD